MEDIKFSGLTKAVNDTYSYVSHNNFYQIGGQQFFDYFSRIIRPLADWLDGYKPGVHDAVENGIVATRLATSMVKGVANTICGKKLRFKMKSIDLESLGSEEGESSTRIKPRTFLDNWARECDLQNTIRRAIRYALALGTSLVKLNVDENSKLWIEAKRLDQFFFNVDLKGELAEVTTLVKTYLNNTANKNDQSFYLVEHRYFVDETRLKGGASGDGTVRLDKISSRAPYVEYSVLTASNLTLNDTTVSLHGYQKVRLDSLPSAIRNSLKRSYRGLLLDKPVRLPFTASLGCQLLKYDGGDLTLPNVPFGTSILQDIQSDLLAYELSYSYMLRDLYNAKGMVLLPDNFSRDKQAGSDGGVFGGPGGGMFFKIPSIDPEQQKPESVQFELRAAEWEQTQNTVLKRIATKIGMSPRTIASYLGNNDATKTATEIDAENDATLSFIEISRGYFEEPLNKLISEVLNYHGYTSNFSIAFGTPSLINKDSVIARQLQLLDSGIIDEEEAIVAIFDDEDEGQLQERIKRLQDRKTAAQQAEQDEAENPFDRLGG